MNMKDIYLTMKKVYKASIIGIKFTSTVQKNDVLNYLWVNLSLKKEETDGNSTKQHVQFLKLLIKTQYHIQVYS